MLTSMWMLCGTMPYLMCLGLKLLRGSNFIFLAFIIMSVISLSLGTGIGSVSTMGIVLLGAGKSMGIDTSVLCGAIVSGAYLGDRSSPLSSAFNLATDITCTDMVSNIRRMNSSLIPAFLISGAVYFWLGLSSPAADSSVIDSTVNSIRQSFNTDILCCAPVIILFACIVLRIPTLTSIFASIAASALIAAWLQDSSSYRILSTALLGYQNSRLDIALHGGGLVSMAGVLITIIFATSFAGLLNGLGLIDTLMNTLSASIKSKRSLLIHSGFISFLLNTMTCNQTIGIIIPGQFMKSQYEKFSMKKEYLVQSIADLGIITVAIVPWNVNSIVVSAVLGTQFSSFAPYSVLCYILPAVFIFMYTFKAVD